VQPPGSAFGSFFGRPFAGPKTVGFGQVTSVGAMYVSMLNGAFVK